MWKRVILILSLILFINGCATIERVKRIEAELARLKEEILLLEQENANLREELRLREKEIEDLQREHKRKMQMPEKKQPPLK